MAFFSEVKAKLGLDIKPFERGLKQAETAAGGLAKGVSKQFMGTEKMAGALAAAIGLNMQSIADGIARFITGVSKEVEAELEATLAKSEEGARKQEASLQKLLQKTEALREKLSERNEKRRLESLTPEARMIELGKEQTELFNRAYKIEKMRRTDTFEYLTIKNRLLDIEEESAAIAKTGGDEAAKRLAETQKTQKEQTDWLDKVISNTEGAMVEAENARLQKLRDQLKVMQAQRSTILQTLADYEAAQRKAVKATTGEIRSGERKPGSRAKRAVGMLDKSQARLRYLEDAEQRKADELAGASSEGARRRIIEEGRAIRAEKEAEFGRSEKLKKGLESRVSDISTNAQSLKELEDINKGIAGLNTKLTDTTL